MENDMYIMYDNYKNSLKALKKNIKKIQNRNVDLRDKDRNMGEEYIFNKNIIDITLMNEMSRDLIYGLEKIESYLDYDDRKYLHSKVKKVSDDILSSYTLYGLVPDGEETYSSDIDNVEDIICDVELQEEIVELLEEILTERQRNVVRLYFWDGLTQEKIAKKLGLTQQGIAKILDNSLELLRNCINYDEIIEFMQN